MPDMEGVNSPGGAKHDIVVVGASAGGVEALAELVRRLPADFAAAVLVVLHLHPASPEVLPKILARHARLPAAPASDGEPIRPGHIYVARPDCHLLVEDGTLRLGHGVREHHARPAVDPLFRSAAQGCGSRVIGVVLSGAGANGTLGLMAVKVHGGITMAQDPNEALWPSMPSSAIRRLHVDYVLPVGQLAEELVRLVDGGLPAPPRGDPPGEMAEADFGAILDQVEHPTPAWPRAEAHQYPSLCTCPECGAVMWSLQPDDLALFRCEIGHVVSGEELLEGQSEGLELALWTAVRLCDQKALLAHRLGQLCSAAGDLPSARGYEAQARLAGQAYETLRGLTERVRLPPDEA